MNHGNMHGLSWWPYNTCTSLTTVSCMYCPGESNKNHWEQAAQINDTKTELQRNQQCLTQQSNNVDNYGPKDDWWDWSQVFIKTLPTIKIYPYYKSINKMIQALHSKASSLPTTLTGRKHGHAGLIVKDALYATLVIGKPWEEPKYPGTSPAIS